MASPLHAGKSQHARDPRSHGTTKRAVVSWKGLFGGAWLSSQVTTYFEWQAGLASVTRIAVARYHGSDTEAFFFGSSVQGPVSRGLGADADWASHVRVGSQPVRSTGRFA